MARPRKRRSAQGRELLSLEIVAGFALLFFFAMLALSIAFEYLSGLSFGTLIPFPLGLLGSSLLCVCVALLWAGTKGRRHRRMAFSVLVAWIIALLAIVLVYGSAL
jgi:hypothetical protein